MKKRVLFVVNSLWGGGAEKVFQTLLCNLNQKKYDITVCAVNEGRISDPYPNEGVRYTHIFDQYRKKSSIGRLWSNLRNKIKLTVYYNLSPKWFYRLFMKGRYDVEVAFIEGYATRIVGGSTNRNSKKLAWVHIDMQNSHWTDVAYRSPDDERRSYKHFDTVLSVSKSVDQSISALYPSINDHRVIYNPIDEKKIFSMSTSALAELPHAAHRLVSVGRLEPQKGYDRLLPIVNRLIKEGHDLSLTIVGEGRQRSELEKYISDNNLTGQVMLTGFQTNPYAWLRQADIFVCSSRAEGYSTVVTEALILGLPVVTTDCAGMGELLDKGKYGLITANTDEALYHGLKSVLDDTEKLAYYKRMATERSGDFKLCRLMSEVEKLLD